MSDKEKNDLSQLPSKVISAGVCIDTANQSVKQRFRRSSNMPFVISVYFARVVKSTLVGAGLRFLIENQLSKYRHSRMSVSNHQEKYTHMAKRHVWRTSKSILHGLKDSALLFRVSLKQNSLLFQMNVQITYESPCT